MASSTGTSASMLARYLNKMVLGMAIFAATLIAVGIYARANIAASGDPREPLKVTTIAAEKQNQYTIPRWFAGRVEARQQVALASELAGKVALVHVDEGDVVSKGEVVVALDTALLDSAKAQLAAQLSGIDAELTLADLRLKRQSDLQAKGFSAEDTIDEIETQITNLQSRREALLTQINEVDIRLDKSIIRAPFDASVQARMVDSGAVINPGTPLVTLLERNVAEVKVGVPLDVAAHLNRGDIRAIRAQTGELEARIISIAPAVDLATQTVAVRLQLDGEQAGNVKLGEYVRLRIETQIGKSGFWIPNVALIEGERGLWNIYSLDEENTVHKHAIDVLYADNERAYVAAAIANDTQVVSSGLHRVAPGMTVSVEK